MCGILAVISKEPPKENIFRAWQSLEKRGPDNFGSWSNGDANLYHTRLSIIDLSEQGNQPMESSRWVLIFNGELYDHMSLRNKLGPMHWASHSDTLTLLMCIEHKGIDWTLQNIEGMFSFAAYDKFEGKLHMAVDPFGIKPLYYINRYDFFACASSPAALTHFQDKWKFNDNALIDMLSLGATRDSLFDGIDKVYGGLHQVFDFAKHSMDSGFYYKPKGQQCTEEDLIGAVKHSIQITKISDVSSFIFLSGGIDSTVVASQCQYMKAIHLKSPEESYAKQAAEKYYNQLHFVEPRDYSAEECLKDYALQSGDCSMAALQPYIVSKEVCKFGKVAISANGADETFFGYNRMHEDVTLEQYQHIFRTGLPHLWGDYLSFQTTRNLELKSYVQFDLNKTLDFASMCHSLEVRVPYLNKTVVEMALSIPRAQHVNGYGNKSILKKFLQREGFNQEFLTRPKIGFSLHTEPSDYAHLKVLGLKLLRDEFDIKTHFYSQRDARYFEASAAAFYCWYEVWKNKLL